MKTKDAYNHEIELPLSLLSKFYVIENLFRWKWKLLNLLFDWVVGVDITTFESLQFDLATIEAATNKFSDDNKIGEGGFGPVYKVDV